MSNLQLTCFGDFQVSLAGEPLTAFPTDKVRALLVYLAAEEQAQPRAALTRLLWPGYSEASATNSLRQTLHRLRHLLQDATADPPWLLITRQTVQFNPAAPLQVDVTLFTQLLAAVATHPHDRLVACPACLARLRQAVELYQGDFLAGFTVADSDPFEEWRRLRQEQLHLQALDALTHLGEAAEANGDTEQALQDAHRQLALEPWLEVAHRRLMRLLARRGQQAAALAQYNRCRQVLAEELGTEPEAETTTLYEQIQRGRLDREVGRGGDKETRRQETRDKETRDKETRDKERCESPVSLSPPLPVSLSPAPPHNLPAALTPFIGRARALAEINSRLAAVRLLTLVGPGGMGKTRLALEVGRQQLAAYPDGVFFVALAALTRPTAIAPAIAASLAATLGVAVQGDPASALYQFLQPRRLLLILDNFEHLLAGSSTAVELIIGLLQAAPALRILVTSRERLQVRGEQLYLVQPFTVAANASLAEAAATSAARLFVQSAQFVQPAFQLTAANLAPVLRICQLVQGMPLGLELAAAQVGVLPLQTIAAEIAQNAEFLQADWHDIPERQRSMRAVFVWSWQLLNEIEQRALRQVAIFRGGFTREAAQAVTGVTFPTLARLAHRSLLYWEAGKEEEGRYAMHELLRQFAAEQLQAVPAEHSAVTMRYRDYYLTFVAEREQRLARREPRQAADEIQGEINNIQQAWRLAVTSPMPGDIDLIERLGRAAYGLWEFLCQRSSRAEAGQMIQLALQRASEAGADPQHPEAQPVISKLLALQAEALVVQGLHTAAIPFARQAIALGQRYGNAVGSIEGETLGMLALAQALNYTNQHAEARTCFAATVQLARGYHHQYLTSEIIVYAEILACEYLACMTSGEGDYPGSRAYMQQSLQLCQTLGKQRSEQQCQYVLARLAYLGGKYPTARDEYGVALRLAQTIGNRLSEAYALIGLGQTLRLQGAYAEAQAALSQGFTLARHLEDPFSQVNALADLVWVHCQLGQPTASMPWHAHLLQLVTLQTLFPESRAYGLNALAFSAHSAGETQQALAYAQQAAQETGDIPYGAALSLVMLGHAQTGVQCWATATVAYQAAVDRYYKLGLAALAAEPQAGLAQIALARGDRAGAKAQVEAILPVLAVEPRAGFNSPFLAYWVGYQVLAANGDPRAMPLLQQGYDLLQQDAAALDDEPRRCFLEAVAINRALVTAYAEACKSLQSS